MKPLRDYQKIRSLVGWILRNKFFQGKRPNQAQVAYLQIGCGPQVAPGFINLDYRWVPGVDVVWDLNVPLPFPAQRFQGIFAEHVLEHLDDDTLLKVLKEALRILRPGGGGFVSLFLLWRFTPGGIWNIAPTQTRNLRV